MKVKERNQEYKQLRDSSPSIFRSSLLMLFYRYGGLFLAPVSVFLGISIIISSTIGDTVIRFLANSSVNLPSPETNRFITILGLAFILVGIMLFIMSRLAKRIIKRNLYILDLQEVMDEQFEN